MQFALFILLNAILFIRPSEIVPALDGLPIYNALMLANLAASGPRMVPLLGPASLRRDPISAAVLGILAAIVLSHLAHLRFDLARWGFGDFGRVVLYYFLLVATIDSPGRLRRFLGWLVLFAIALTSIALLQYHGLVDIASLAPVADAEVDPATGESYTVMRLCSTGIYNDPNDLSLILLTGMASCAFLATSRPGLATRLAKLAPIGLFGNALMLTHSRGGFLAMIAGATGLVLTLYGWRKALPLLALGIPACAILFAGRQTNISSDDTGQDRIQLWSEGIAMLREAPLFGVGWNTYQDRVGLVAHNSFVHGFAELGLFGGGLYLGAFGYILGTLNRLKARSAEIPDPELRALRPFILAMVLAYAAGSMTVSRNYVIPTYMMLGLGSAYLRCVLRAAPWLTPDPILAVDGRLLGRWAVGAIGFLIFIFGFIRVFVRYG